MKGAEKIFIHGEEIARAKDVAQSEQNLLNTLFQEDANVRNELNQRIDDMPVFYPQDLVDSGFDYTYEDTTQLSSVVVEVLPYGSGAGFTLQDDGYYHADNVGVDQSYAMAKIIFHNESDTEQEACVEIHQIAEQGCDYFVISILNTDLDDDINDSMNVDWTFDEGNMQRNILYSVPVGDSYTIIKYRKDASVSAEEETAKFKASAAHPVITETKHLATTEGVEEQIKQAVSTVYKYKGSVANEASLPATDNEVGDVYNCEDTGNNFAWTGTAWDKLAGTVDMSNYYTKAQSDASARAIADDKIADIPVNDLLHYKGHVDTVDGLPTLGQESAAINTAAPNYNSVNIGRKDTNLSAYDVTAGPSTLYYVASRYKETSNSVPDGCLCLKTNYPEMISVVRYDMNSHSIGIVVQYNADKPVYWDGNWSGDWLPVSENKMFMVYNGAIRTNFPLKTPTWIPGNISSIIGGGGYSGNVTQKYRYAQATNPATNLTYYYDPGYIVLVPESDTSDYVRLYFGDSLAKHRDVYTVGENNDIYYCNTLQEWEHWSKAPINVATEDYVNNAINAIEIIKKQDTLPEPIFSLWDGTSDVSGKEIKISEGLHNYFVQYANKSATFFTTLASDAGYTIAVDSTKETDTQYAWVLLDSDNNVVQHIANIDKTGYTNYEAINGTMPDDVGVFTHQHLGTTYMPNALYIAEGYPEGCIYQVNGVFYLSDGTNLHKINTQIV